MAISFLKKIILIQPENNALYYHIARLYAKQNKSERLHGLKKRLKKDIKTGN